MHRESVDPRKVTKQKMIGDRIIELTKSLQVIRDALDLVKQGRAYQIIPLCGQLRALLTEKSKKNKPLLIHLAEILDKKLMIFSMPDTENSSVPFKDEILFHMAGFPITLFKEHPLQTEISLSDLLKEKLINFKKITCSIKEIIDFYANKAGGAHYATELPLYFSEILSLKVPVLEQALTQIGQITLEIGINFLKILTDFELHILLFVPEQKIDQYAFIMDNKYPNSPMRFFLALNKQKKLIFGLIGLDGNRIEMPINRLLDLKRPFHFTAIFSIEKNLSTKVILLINGNSITTVECAFPLVTIPDMSQYDSYINKSFDQQSQDLEIGFMQICLFNKTLEPLERAKMYIFFEETRNQDNAGFVLYSRGSYGYAAVGETNYNHFGDVKFKQVVTADTET